METIMQNIPTCQALMQGAFNMQMVVQMNKMCKKTRCVMVNEISNFGQGLYPPACIYSLTGIMDKSLDPTLIIHISSGFVWWESRYRKGNTALYGKEFPLCCLIWPLGDPIGHGIQFQGKGILCHNIYQISDLV